MKNVILEMKIVIIQEITKIKNVILETNLKTTIKIVNLIKKNEGYIFILFFELLDEKKYTLFFYESY